MLERLPGTLHRLSDAELVARVKSFAGAQRDATAHLVALLAELDTRDVHLKEGYGSLFVYCRDALALSEQAAYNHIQAARAVRRFPAILEMLAEGSVNLITVSLLAPHLTAENHGRALESARGRTKIQVEEIVARLLPRPDVASSIRRLPAPKPAAWAPPVASAGAAPAVVPAAAASRSPAPPPSGGATALSPDRYRLQLTIGGDTLEKLRLAKDMLRHAIPWGDEAALLDRALTALLAELARKKFAAAEQPRPLQATSPGSRHVPAEVRRAVWVRDLGRCAFVGTHGRRCDERGFLEFHHVRPYAAGGEASAGNIQLRCRRHNDYEARVYFGWDSQNGHAGTGPGTPLIPERGGPERL